MFVKERQEKIEQIIVSQGSATVLELSELFDVSEVTIRKDLDELSKKDLITRMHGGAVAKYQSMLSVEMSDLASSHPEEKKQIARCAMNYIKEGDSILLDASSTVMELALLINESDIRNLVVITPCISIAQVLTRDAIQIIIIGGDFNRRLNTSRGHLTVNQINSLSADKCFIGVNGIDDKFGYSAGEFEDAAIKKAMVDVSKQVFILADHSKMHKRYLAQIKKLDDEVVVTDSYAKNIDYTTIEKKVTVIHAN